jgi:arabinogalactan oligomer / maltooligosaccharide transport system substrate-binding protein
MKSPIRLTGLLAGAILVIAACGPGGTGTNAPATGGPATGAPATGAPATGGAPASEAPAALSGDLTLWHSYGSGGGETGALNDVLAAVKADHPDLNVTVVEQPFSDIFTKWQTDVLAGQETPDLYIAPNDSLYSQSDAGALADITSQLSGKLEGFSQVAVDGSQVDGKFYMVPESLKAVALWYDKSAIPTPPATTAELLAGVQSGAIKLGLNQGVYHLFGLSGSFGGELMDASGKCVADQGGWADALKYLQDLKAAGATFNPDGNALKQDFQTGAINATIDGPWQTADFKTALGDKLAVAPIPAGPNGDKANPLTGTDGWYINPNSPNVDLAVQFALEMVGTENAQIFADKAGHVPAAPGVTIADPITQGFADAAAGGLPRPQNAELNNFWGNFGDAVNKAVDTAADPTTAIADACAAMNTANNKT